MVQPRKQFAVLSGSTKGSRRQMPVEPGNALAHRGRVVHDRAVVQAFEEQEPAVGARGVVERLALLPRDVRVGSAMDQQDLRRRRRDGRDGVGVVGTEGAEIARAIHRG